MNKNYKGYKMKQKIKKDLQKQNNSLLYVSVKDNNIEELLGNLKKESRILIY